MKSSPHPVHSARMLNTPWARVTWAWYISAWMLGVHVSLSTPSGRWTVVSSTLASLITASRVR